MDMLALIHAKKPGTIGIDGNSGAGKTTLAKELAEKLNGQIIPFDLFHKKERKDWNLKTDINDFGDFEKANQVIKRLLKGESFTLHNLYNHVDGTHSRSFRFEPKEVLIVEGLCVMRLNLDFKIFLHVDPKVALIRGKDRDIKERNLTEKQWVIKKHLFHDEYSKIIPELKNLADLIIDTTDHFPEIK
jgi:uridine kinase